MVQISADIPESLKAALEEKAARSVVLDEFADMKQDRSPSPTPGQRVDRDPEIATAKCLPNQ